MPASLHELLWVFPALRRPGRVLTISEINRAGYGRSNINRGATPMRAALHGLLRVFPVLRRPGRARTPGDTPRRRLASLGCARSSPFASAKQRAYRQRSLPGRLRTPRTASRARGLRPEKPSAFRGEAKAKRTRTSVGSLPVIVLVRVADASPRKAEGFFGLPARTRSCARGVEVSGVKNAAQRARFSGLAKEAQRCRRRVGPTKVRACRPTPEHRKNP